MISFVQILNAKFLNFLEVENIEFTAPTGLIFNSQKVYTLKLIFTLKIKMFGIPILITKETGSLQQTEIT